MKLNIKPLAIVTTLSAMSVLPGCGSEGNDGPPEILYGDSICAECGMILSDERFAVATLIDGDRGIEPLVFDDFNCQMIYEGKHPDLTIVDRWSHDYNGKQWMHMADAWFVQSDELHTPMASHIASFASKDEAQRFADGIAGRVMGLDALREAN